MRVKNAAYSTPQQTLSNIHPLRNTDNNKFAKQSGNFTKIFTLAAFSFHDLPYTHPENSHTVESVKT